MTHATTQGAAADSREAVRMYPNNGLGKQFHALPGTFFGYELLAKTFGKK